jgi:hypothetical protein
MTLPPPRKLTALAAVGAIAVPATAAATTASNAAYWQAKGIPIACGLEIHSGPTATKVLCSAKSIPAPKHGFGDPGFVNLGATGSPQLLRLTQNSFAGKNLKTLKKGTLWSSIGVTCNVGAASVLCFNGDNHGFLITKKHYTSF